VRVGAALTTPGRGSAPPDGSGSASAIALAPDVDSITEYPAILRADGARERCALRDHGQRSWARQREDGRVAFFWWRRRDLRPGRDGNQGAGRDGSGSSQRDHRFDVGLVWPVGGAHADTTTNKPIRMEPMTEELCIHGIDPATCSICKRTSTPKARQATLNYESIEIAVRELASTGEFRTKDVSHHEAVQAAHPGVRDDPRFDQQIGSYLTEAVGRLRIRQASPKGQSNARWRAR
jgi:hypothetical protein